MADPRPVPSGGAAEEAEERTRDEIAEPAEEVRELRALLARRGGPSR